MFLMTASSAGSWQWRFHITPTSSKRVILRCHRPVPGSSTIVRLLKAYRE
jgi:hypothetical protein